MRRYFRGEEQQMTTVAKTSLSDTINQTGEGTTDTTSDMRFDGDYGDSRTEDDTNDWDNTISPIKNRARRSGKVYEEKFTIANGAAGAGIMATSQGGKKNNDINT